MVSGKTKDYNFAWERPVFKTVFLVVSGPKCLICQLKHLCWSNVAMFFSYLISECSVWFACYINESPRLSYIAQLAKLKLKNFGKVIRQTLESSFKSNIYPSHS